MQSRVVAFGVFFNHSMTALSSSSAVGVIAVPAPPCALRFLGFNGAAPLPGKSSAAFRLWSTLCPAGLAIGVVARLSPTPFGLLDRVTWPESGLVPRLAPFGFVLRPFGLVARLATTECPPRTVDVGAGEVEREPA